VDGGVVGWGEGAVIEDDDLRIAAELAAEGLCGEEIHEDFAVADHGDEGE